MKFSTKKFTAGILMLAVVVFYLSYAAYASYDVRILIDGEDISFSQKPVIENGTTLVPMRDVFEGLGAIVSWDNESRTATGEYNGTVISVLPDSAEIFKNGEKMRLSHDPIIINDRVMLPLRAVSEGFGYNVMWRGSDYTVSITKGELLKAYFLDCGQADSIFAELPDGKCMLIDAGEKAFGKELEAFIKEKGYTHIDYVIASHPHSDHIGGMAHIIKSFSIGTFYMPEVSHTTKTFEEMIDALSEKGCSCEYISAGSVIEALPYSIMVLAPENHTYSKMNNYSAVVRLSYKNVSVMFSADAEAESEKEILKGRKDIDSDVLKVGHHGSRSSTTDEYLDKLSVSDAIISLGENNSYNFPSEIVLNRLNNRGITVYRTDTDGTITMVTDGYVYAIEGDK